MNQKVVFVLIGLVIAGLAFGGGILVGYSSHSTATAALPPATATSVTPQHVYLSILQNPGDGIDTYLPANLTVAANTPIIITITNYDNGTNPVPADAARLIGTVGGTMVREANAPSGGQVVSGGIENTTVSHTFSVVGPDGSFIVNVPIPAAADSNHPEVVTFTLQFAKSGTYTWLCRAPCDNGAMGKPGYMMGSLSVAA